jgi:hypothetical protein
MTTLITRDRWAAATHDGGAFVVLDTMGTTIPIDGVVTTAIEAPDEAGTDLAEREQPEPRGVPERRPRARPSRCSRHPQ